MKFNTALTCFALTSSVVFIQGCLPLLPVEEGERTSEEIFSFRNETGKDVRASVYFYEKNFTAQERDLIDLRLEVAKLETEVKTENEKPADQIDKAKFDDLSARLEKTRSEYMDLYSKVNNSDFDKEVYKETDGGKIQVYSAREMLQDSIVRFVSDERFINNIAARANIYMFGANLAIAHEGSLYLYDLEPVYSNIVRFQKNTVEITPTLPAFFPFRYEWNNYRVNLRKDNQMSDDYRLKRLIVANFMPAYNFGIGKRDMPRNGFLRYQFVLLDDMKLYVRELDNAINEYWGTREDFIAKFKDGQDAYRGFPISPARVISAEELAEIRKVKTSDDFSWALTEPHRKPLPESRKTFDETMYGIMVDAIRQSK